MRNIFYLAIGLTVVSGCEAGFGVAPKDSLKSGRNFSEIIVNNTLEEGYLAGLSQRVPLKEERNRVILARLSELDILYFRYETSVSVELRRGNFATSLAGLLIGAAGARASAAAAQNYSALGGVLTGATAAYEKEVLLDQSLQAFISQMRSNRDRVKSKILDRLKLEPAGYSLQAAAADLAEYQHAGTLSAAITAITENAQQNEQKSSDLKATTEARVLPELSKTSGDALVANDRSRIKITGYLDGAETDDDRNKRNQKMIQCFDESDATPKPTSFQQYLQNSPDFLSLGAALAKCATDSP